MTCNFIFSKILTPHVSEKQTKKKELKKLISRLSFYCHLPVVENCLKKCLLVLKEKNIQMKTTHGVESVQIRSFFRSVFSRNRTEYMDLPSKSAYSVRMRENTDQKKLRI